VGSVGHETPLCVDRLFECAEHRVERCPEPAELVGTAGVRHAFARIARAGNPLSCAREPPDRDESRARFLDRIQVGALQILDERELETVPHLLADDRRNGRLPGEARGKDSPMSGDELVPVSIGRYHNRLQNAVAGD